MILKWELKEDREKIAQFFNMFINKAIVFTNGCFDIFHPGHLKILNTLKVISSHNEILKLSSSVVAINSDISVKKIKGEERPVFDQNHRASIVDSFHDGITIVFDDETPEKLINFIKPTIILKGSEYTGSKVVGSEVAKVVLFVDMEKDISTTKIIESYK